MSTLPQTKKPKLPKKGVINSYKIQKRKKCAKFIWKMITFIEECEGKLLKCGDATYS